MNKADGQDTAERLTAIVANSLDTPAKTQDLARQAYRSRTQFHRLFRTAAEEGPAAMRRRHTDWGIAECRSRKLPWTLTMVR
jgi:AraC family transcriptional regulator